MLQLSSDRAHTCAFTGHRPQKLDLTEAEIKPLIEKEIALALSEGYLTFITGMAEGVDMWAAELVLEARAAHPEVRLICALPYPGFCARRTACAPILAAADGVVSVCPERTRDCYQRRNCCMVDSASRLIAVYGGGPGGTRNTLDYARGRCDMRIIPLT